MIVCVHETALFQRDENDFDARMAAMERVSVKGRVSHRDLSEGLHVKRLLWSDATLVSCVDSDKLMVGTWSPGH